MIMPCPEGLISSLSIQVSILYGTKPGKIKNHERNKNLYEDQISLIPHVFSGQVYSNNSWSRKLIPYEKRVRFCLEMLAFDSILGHAMLTR